MEAMQIYQGTVLNQAQSITTAMFDDFVSYIDRSAKTTRTYLTNLRQFMAWLRYTDISQPVRQDILSYRNWLIKEHEAISFEPTSCVGWAYRTDKSGNTVKIVCKPSTVKGYLQAVKAFFAWTDSNNIYPDIAKNVHAPKISDTHKKDCFTASEVFAIESSIASHAAARTESAAEQSKDTAGRIQRSTEQGKRLYAMYLLCVNAGLRTVEISRANIKDIETKGGRSYLMIWGKGHSEPDQKKPLAKEVKAAIDDYINSRTDHPTGSSPLFVSTGNRSKGKRIATTTISTMLKTAMKEAGFDSDRLTAHSLRHSTAQNVMDLTGNNIYMTQQYLRHNSPKTTEIYLENDSTEQDEQIANQLYKRFHGAAEATGTDEQLQNIIAMMNPDMVDQLLTIAKAMRK